MISKLVDQLVYMVLSILDDFVLFLIAPVIKYLEMPFYDIYKNQLIIKPSKINSSIIVSNTLNSNKRMINYSVINSSISNLQD